MSILVQSVSMQQLKHEFESFLKRFYRKLLVLQPQIYVSLRLRMQNAVPAQPCVGKIQISLVLFNFLYCNFRLWFETP